MTSYSAAEIRQRYDDFAQRYARMEGLQEALLAMRRRRARVFANARGDVLEVAVGTGVNLPHYARDCRLTAVDVSPRMLDIARRRAAALGLTVALHEMDATALEFPDDSFDTVTSSLTTCTFPDPVAALAEMGRVCRPDGQVLLLEHGRSDRGWCGRYQDRRAERHAHALGCQWNREPLDLVAQAGLTVVAARRGLLGTFHEITARPPA